MSNEEEEEEEIEIVKKDISTEAYLSALLTFDSIFIALLSAMLLFQLDDLEGKPSLVLTFALLSELFFNYPKFFFTLLALAWFIISTGFIFLIILAPVPSINAIMGSAFIGFVCTLIAIILFVFEISPLWGYIAVVFLLVIPLFVIIDYKFWGWFGRYRQDRGRPTEGFPGLVIEGKGIKNMLKVTKEKLKELEVPEELELSALKGLLEVFEELVTSTDEPRLTEELEELKRLIEELNKSTKKEKRENKEKKEIDR